MKITDILMAMCVSVILISCSAADSTICGRYTESELYSAGSNGKPTWIDYPGKGCSVGYSDWGNTSKDKARLAAIVMAKESLVREIAPETVRVDSEMEIKKTQSNDNVVVTAKGTSRLSSEGEEIQIKTKVRAVWFEGYKVWVLVERIK